jgi:transcription-repair coupling factor (superfamily II helicase)
MEKINKNWKKLLFKYFNSKRLDPGIYKVYDKGAEILEALRLSPQEKDGTTLLIFPDLNDAENSRTLLETWHNFLEIEKDCLLFPELVSGNKLIASSDQARAKVLKKIVSDSAFIITTSVSGALSSVPDLTNFLDSIIKIRIGDEINLTELTEKLIDFDYADEYEVGEPAEFSKRGGIIDIYSPAYDYPVRIEFWGDTIDSIRIFDPETQKSIKNCDSYDIISAIPFTENEESRIFLTEYLKYKPSKIIVIHPEECHQHLKKFSEKKLEHWISFIESEKNKIFFITSEDECVLSSEQLPEFQTQIRKTSGFIFGDDIDDEISDEMFAQWHRQLILDRIKQWLDTDYTVIISGAHDNSISYLKEWSASNKINIKNIFFSELQFPFGICFIKEKTVILTEKELFSTIKHNTSISAFAEKNFKNTFSKISKKFDNDENIFFHLEPGDYAVHINHGICIYKGMEEMQDGEMFKLEFEDEVILYVPIRNANLLSRYIGSKKDLPKLHKIGSAKWMKDKVSAARDIRIMAGELLQVQAARLKFKGFAFPQDDLHQHIFEESFPFNPTQDQIISSMEIKNDMIKPAPMDRLLCGDVGFGKTEIAMRAAFKAVSAGKQVVVLVPTTILAQQHYYSFKERFAEHPFFIEMLSRFRTSAEQKNIIKNTSEGLVDILIGTHRILQNDIKLKDLGLVVIDEEQRFGVSHKEKLKKLRTMVDVLTMTATPIPRTMYMSMTGLRDLSTLKTAPGKRVPTRTFIAKYDEKIIKDAILNEISRGGQVYYLHNRVKTIYQCKDTLQNLLPDVKFAIAHGRMVEKELENIMGKFLDGKIDVLICTTIIESGLDIPNTNTIIIERADRFGLSELYQLRGRVGRWHRQAYAYLLMPPDSIITGNARKRIAAIKKFSELGAGFRLAMRDLEIRGSGNILGAKQSGHINAIGFELYCSLLRSAVHEQKNGKPLILAQVDIDIDFLKFSNGNSPDYIYACIPSSYIPSETTRTEFYKKFAKITLNTELIEIKRELEDRFGKIPEEISNFIQYSKIRMILSHNGITFLRVSNTNVFLKRHTSYLKINNKIPVLKLSKPKNMFKNLMVLIKNIIK